MGSLSRGLLLTLGIAASPVLSAKDEVSVETLADIQIRLDVMARWELGQSLLEKGHFSAAAAELERVHSYFPDNDQIITSLSSAHLMAGEIDEGEALLRTALLKNPEHENGEELLIRVLFAQEKWVEGFARCESLIKKHPDRKALRLFLAEAYLRSGDSHRAGPHLQILGPNGAEEPGEWHRLEAWYLLEQNRFAEAYAEATLASMRLPQRPEVWKWLGLAALRMGHFEEAFEDLQKALKGGETEARVFLALGDACFQLLEWDQAEHVWEMGLEWHPEDLSLLSRRLDFAFQSGHPELALAQLKNLPKTLQRSPIQSLLEARFERKSGYPSLALRKLKWVKARAGIEIEQELRWEEVLIQMELERWSRAEKLAMGLMDEGIRNGECLLIRARTAMARGASYEAGVYFQEAIRREPALAKVPVRSVRGLPKLESFSVALEASR